MPRCPCRGAALGLRAQEESRDSVADPRGGIHTCMRAAEILDDRILLPRKLILYTG